MVTKKLYFENAYETEFDAYVVSCEKKGETWLVELDKSLFYPEGGGQPGDTGSFILSGPETVKVKDTHEKDGSVLHYCEKEVPQGTRVHGIIDFKRRFDFMQQHSGEHIVSGMICSKFNCDNVGFHLGKETVTIDFNTLISLEDLREIEKKANSYIWEDHPVKELWAESAELEKINYRSKKEIEGPVRIVIFPGADTCTCCGTHVKRSSEVGLVKIISCQKFKKGSRIELLSGRRAYEYLDTNWQQNMLISHSLSAHFDDTYRIFKKEMEDVSKLKARGVRLEKKYLDLLATKYNGAGDILIIEDDLSQDFMRRLCVSIAKVCGGRCAVFSRGECHEKDNVTAVNEASGGVDSKSNPELESKVRYSYAVSIKAGEDIKPFIKIMNDVLRGRGGGRDGFALGYCLASRDEIKDFFGNNS